LLEKKQLTALHGNTGKHRATHRNTLQQIYLTAGMQERCVAQKTATHYNTLQQNTSHSRTLHHTAAHCNTRQHTATHNNPLRQIYLTASVRERCVARKMATHCNTLQLNASHRNTHNTPQHTARHCNKLQDTATHCKTLQQIYLTAGMRERRVARKTANHCNKLQQNTPNNNTPQHTAKNATRCNKYT